MLWNQYHLKSPEFIFFKNIFLMSIIDFVKEKGCIAEKFKARKR